MMQQTPAPQPIDQTKVHYVNMPPQEGMPQQVIIYQNAPAPDRSEQTSLCLMIVGVLIPIAALINVCMYIGSQNPKAKLYAKISIVTSIVNIAAFWYFRVYY